MSNATINRGSAADGWAMRPRLRDASFVVRDEAGRWFVPTWIDRPVSRAWWKWGARHPDPVLAKAQSEAKRDLPWESMPGVMLGIIFTFWVRQQPWDMSRKIGVWILGLFAGTYILTWATYWLVVRWLPARNATRAAQMLVAVNRCGVCAEPLSRDEHDRPRTCGTCSATWKPARAVSKLSCFGCGESLQLDADQSTLRCISCGFDHWPIVQAARDAQHAAMRRRLTCAGCGYDRRGLANVETDACPECGLSPASVLDMIEKLGADRGFKPDRSSPPPL